MMLCVMLDMHPCTKIKCDRFKLYSNVASPAKSVCSIRGAESGEAEELCDIKSFIFCNILT
jgi:hypothetical protein